MYQSLQTTRFQTDQILNAAMERVSDMRDTNIFLTILERNQRESAYMRVSFEK